MTDRLKRSRGSPLFIGLIVGLAACSETDDPVVVSPDDFDPEIVDVRATWVEEGWSDRDPVGTAAVQIFWRLPEDWDGESFRVYSRASGSGDYLLIATVTSCAARQCVYTDANVQAGRAYDYFVVSVDERTNREIGESEVWDVAVPEVSQPTMPADIVAVPLDNGVYLRWESVGAARYRIFLEGLDGEAVFFEVGSTDGAAYVDTRAENGTTHTYGVASVSDAGYVSRRSEPVSATPRPDYSAELIYTVADNAAESGFRFTGSEGENPILAGTSADAHWRLEESGGELRVVPLNGTRVTMGTFTSDLTCGPASDADCEHVAEAPPSSAFGTAPVMVSPGNTYVFEVTVGGQTHFGKIRAQGGGEDSQGRNLLVFDWAYQLLPDQPSLNLSPLSR